MSDPIPLQSPGGFAPTMALGIDDGTGNLALIRSADPLPVRSTPEISPAALEGQVFGAFTVGPFAPVALKPVVCTLSGIWQGRVAILRSTDDGANLHPLTAGGSAWGAFSANACEPVWEESEDGATLWLQGRVDTGMLTYRLAQ